MEKPIDPKIVETLILSGAIEVSGMSEDGYMTYKFTENAKEIVPELYDTYMSGFYSDLMKLWEKGFLSMDITDENPIVTVVATKLSDDFQVSLLTEEERKTLDFIIASMKR